MISTQGSIIGHHQLKLSNLSRQSEHMAVLSLCFTFFHCCFKWNVYPCCTSHRLLFTIAARMLRTYVFPVSVSHTFVNCVLGHFDDLVGLYNVWYDTTELLLSEVLWYFFFQQGCSSNIVSDNGRITFSTRVLTLLAGRHHWFYFSLATKASKG